MNNRVAKLRWGPGPWQDEPDRLDWTDERTGLRCEITRNMAMGHLCGYVAVPPSHPYFGWGWDDDIKLAPGDLDNTTIDDVGVFETVIYAFKGGPEHGTIPLSMTLKAHHGINWSCEEDGLWWYGFDCGHAWDICPGMAFRSLFDDLPVPERKYRDIEYVKKEVTSLAFQLRQLETRVLIEDGILQFCGKKA